MFDDGDNVVTMNVVGDSGEEDHQADLLPPGLSSNFSRRSFAIDSWNGSPGLSHWGYGQPDEPHQLVKHSLLERLQGLDAIIVVSVDRTCASGRRELGIHHEMVTLPRFKSLKTERMTQRWHLSPPSIMSLLYYCIFMPNLTFRFDMICGHKLNIANSESALPQLHSSSLKNTCRRSFISMHE